MRHYHLHCFSNGAIFRCEDIVAADDAGAIEEALAIRGAAAAELWEGDRKVHRFVQAPILLAVAHD
jgi:hypothetical protein